MMKIVTIPHPVLTSPTKHVKTFDAALKKLVKEMEVALNACIDPQGVGLAATQVGLDISLFIMKPDPDAPILICINPKITEFEEAWPKKDKKKEKDTPLEGCLSIPKIWSPVKRKYRVHLEYQDIDGTIEQEWFEDFESIIVQHEVDHLNGILFTQRALEQDVQLYEEKNGELEKMKTDL